MSDNRSNQLKAVESKARKLLRFFEEEHNFDLPVSFPTDQVQDIARGMGKVSQSLPDKLEKALDYATKRLNDIRYEHVPFDDNLGYGRNSYFDDLIAALISEIGTARGMYAKPDDELEQQTPEADVQLSEEARDRADNLVGGSQELSERFDITISEARRLVDELGLVGAEEMLQSLTTGDILNDLSRAELRDDPRPGWLRSLSSEVEAMPERILDAGDRVRVGEGIEKLGEAIAAFNAWRKDPLGQIATRLKAFGQRMKEEAAALESAAPVDDVEQVSSEIPPFDLDKIHQDLLQGIPPHSAHVPQITELLFSGEEHLSGLSAFSGLSELRELDLSGTSISDSSLRDIEKLEKLFILWLADTAISDEGARYLSKLKYLEFLSIDRTPITDRALTEISKIERLTHLYISGTSISDHGLEKIGSMKTLTHLGIEHTKISEVGLAHLLKLENLRVLFLPNVGFSDSPSVNELVESGVVVESDVDLRDYSDTKTSP